MLACAHTYIHYIHIYMHTHIHAYTHTHTDTRYIHSAMIIWLIYTHTYTHTHTQICGAFNRRHDRFALMIRTYVQIFRNLSIIAAESHDSRDISYWHHHSIDTLPHASSLATVNLTRYTAADGTVYTMLGEDPNLPDAPDGYVASGFFRKSVKKTPVPSLSPVVEVVQNNNNNNDNNSLSLSLSLGVGTSVSLADTTGAGLLNNTRGLDDINNVERLGSDHIKPQDNAVDSDSGRTGIQNSPQETSAVPSASQVTATVDANNNPGLLQSASQVTAEADIQPSKLSAATLLKSESEFLPEAPNAIVQGGGSDSASTGAKPPS